MACRRTSMSWLIGLHPFSFRLLTYGNHMVEVSNGSTSPSCGLSARDHVRCDVEVGFLPLTSTWTRRAACPAARLVPGLLPFVIFHHLVDLSLDLIEVEARRCLHGWKLDRRLRKICHRVLYVDEAPELT